MPLYSCPVRVTKVWPDTISTQCALMTIVFNRQELKNSILGNTYFKLENNYDYKSNCCMHYLPRGSVQKLEMYDQNKQSFLVIFQTLSSKYLISCAPIVAEDRISFEKIIWFLKQVENDEMKQDVFYINNVIRSIEEISIRNKDDVKTEYDFSSEVRLFISTIDFRLFWDTFRESKMQIVDLQLIDSNIKKISKKFKHLKYLAFLNLSGNHIRKWNWLLKYGLNTRLNSLNISRNNLNELPIQVLLLENLHALNLEANPIEILPKYMHFLKNLHYLNITDTKLTYLPITINRLFLMEFIHNDLNVKCNYKIVKNDSKHQELIQALKSFSLCGKDKIDSILRTEFNDKYNLICACGRQFQNRVFCKISNKQRLIFNGQLVSFEMYFCSIECIDYVKIN